MDLLNRPNIDVPDVRSKVHEMLIHLVNAQVALGEAQIEISELRGKLDDREAIKLLAEDMEFIQDGGFYRRKSESAGGVFNPYCPVCWGNNQKAIPLAPILNGFYTCAFHKTNYQTQAAREEQKRLDEQRRADETAVAVFPMLIR